MFLCVKYFLLSSIFLICAFLLSPIFTKSTAIAQQTLIDECTYEFSSGSCSRSLGNTNCTAFGGVINGRDCCNLLADCYQNGNCGTIPDRLIPPSFVGQGFHDTSHMQVTATCKDYYVDNVFAHNNNNNICGPSIPLNSCPAPTITAQEAFCCSYSVQQPPAAQCTPANQAINCNDNNPCTDDLCSVANSTCANVNKPNGAVCSTQPPLLDNGTCQNGTCVANSTTRTCSSSDCGACTRCEDCFINQSCGWNGSSCQSGGPACPAGARTWNWDNCTDNVCAVSGGGGSTGGGTSTPSLSSFSPAGCSDNNFNAGISWSGNSLPSSDSGCSNGFWVDVANNSGFNDFSHKCVRGNATVAPSGFGGAFSFQAGQTYYARVFNGVHSNTLSLAVPNPACTSAPPPAPINSDVAPPLLPIVVNVYNDTTKLTVNNTSKQDSTTIAAQDGDLLRIVMVGQNRTNEMVPAYHGTESNITMRMDNLPDELGNPIDLPFDCNPNGRSIICTDTTNGLSIDKDGSTIERGFNFRVNSSASFTIPAATLLQSQRYNKPTFPAAGRYPSNDWGKDFTCGDHCDIGSNEYFSFTSNSVSVELAGVKACPTAPTGLVPSGNINTCSSTVTLSWVPVANATSLNIRADDTINDVKDLRNNCGPHAVCINGLSPDPNTGLLPTSLTIPVVPGRTYTWWVESVGANTCTNPQVSVHKTFTLNCTSPSISGQVWVDCNSNGDIDTGDKTLPNAASATVCLDPNGGDPATACSGRPSASVSSRSYSFSGNTNNLPGGNHNVYIQLPNGYEIKNPPSPNLQQYSASQVINSGVLTAYTPSIINFGVYSASVCTLPGGGPPIGGGGGGSSCSLSINGVAAPNPVTVKTGQTFNISATAPGNFNFSAGGYAGGTYEHVYLGTATPSITAPSTATDITISIDDSNWQGTCSKSQTVHVAAATCDQQGSGLIWYISAVAFNDLEYNGTIYSCQNIDNDPNCNLFSYWPFQYTIDDPRYVFNMRLDPEKPLSGIKIHADDTTCSGDFTQVKTTDNNGMALFLLRAVIGGSDNRTPVQYRVWAEVPNGYSFTKGSSVRIIGSRGAQFPNYFEDSQVIGITTPPIYDMHASLTDNNSTARPNAVSFGFLKNTPAWLQTTSGSVHSNSSINTPGGPQ